MRRWWDGWGSCTIGSTTSSVTRYSNERLPRPDVDLDEDDCEEEEEDSFLFQDSEGAAAVKFDYEEVFVVADEALLSVEALEAVVLLDYEVLPDISEAEGVDGVEVLAEFDEEEVFVYVVILAFDASVALFVVLFVVSLAVALVDTFSVVLTDGVSVGVVSVDESVVISPMISVPSQPPSLVLFGMWLILESSLTCGWKSLTDTAPGFTYAVVEGVL